MQGEILAPRSLPKKYADCSIEQVSSGLEWNSVRDYYNSPGKYLHHGVGLVLSGPNGCGKTGAAAVLYKKVKESRPSWGSRNVVWASSRDIATYYGHYLTEGVFDIPVDEFYNTAKWLVIDELGRESNEKNFDRRLYSLLKARSDEKLTTLFTTNLSLRDNPEDRNTVVGLYGNSFYSLLHEACVLVSVIGDDRRRNE